MFQQTPQKRVLFPHCLKQLVLGVFLLSVAGISLLLASRPVVAAPSTTINFQARLMNATGSIVPDGYYNVEFKLYSASSGGTALWTEDYYDSNGVTAGNDNRAQVKNGYLSVALGSQTAFPGSIDWDQQLYLSMNVGGTTQTATPTWNGEMSPRLALTAVPYAFKAESLAHTDGANRSTLGWVTQTGSHGILLPDEAGTLCIQASTNCGFAAASGSGSYVQNTATLQTGANIAIESASAGSVGALIQGNSSQTADILQVKANGVANPLFAVSATGASTFRNSTNSTAAFQVQNALGSNMLSVDTTHSAVIVGQVAGGTAAAAALYFGDTCSNFTQTCIKIGEYGGTDSDQLQLHGAAGIVLTAGYNTQNVVAAVSNTGATRFQNSTDSTTAFRVQNVAGDSLLSVDTSTSNISLLSNNSPTLSSWSTTTAMSVTSNSSTLRVRGSAVAANGYLYHLGGLDGSGATTTSVEYAKLNADGTVGSWAATTSLPGARRQFQAVVANGYVYVIGGRDGSNVAQSTAYYAKLNADGTLGSWNSTTALTSGTVARFGHGTVAYNGYMYIIGGFNNTPTALDTMYAAKINADGTLASTWTSVSTLPTTLANINNGAIVANGYLYLPGGFDGTTGTDSIRRAKINTDGTIGSWTTQTTVIPGGGDENFVSHVANGWLYLVGGDSGSRVSAFKLNADGSVGTVNNSSLFSLTNFPVNVGEAGGALANGYFYVLGGSSSNDGSGTMRNTVYYASTSRVTIGGGLDLVNYSGENLTEGNTGGQLTAGNTIVVGTLQVQDTAVFVQGVSIDGTLRVSGGAAFRNTTNSSTAFLVQNSSGSTVFGVDTSGSQSLFGQAASTTGKLVLYNATNSNTVTLQSGTTSSSYTLTMPTALGTTGDCLKDTTGTGVLGWGACGTGGGGGGSTLQNAYDNSGTTSPQIALSTTNGGIKIQDASGGVSGNLFQIQNSAGTATYFGLSTTGLTMQDSSGNNAFVFDTSTSHLRIYANTTNPTLYADIYYDDVNGEAVFAASSGVTRIGNGSGNITMQLAAAADIFQATKTVTLASSYSNVDFTFTRNITAGANALTGSVVKIESTSSGSSTVASNILWLNENNTSATGNLILATTGGAGNDKFKVNTGGTVTIASGQSYTGAGAVSLTSGASSALTITGNAASTWSTSSGDLTLQAGGASKIVVKPGTNSTSSFEIQNSGGTALLTADSNGGNIQIGSASSNAVANLLVLDSYNQSSDPTGVEGAMYYNTTSKSFRCYMNGRWRACVSGVVFANTTIQGGDTVANTTSETNFASNYSIPANDCQPGRVFRVTAQGLYSTAGTAPTLNMRVKFGTTVLVASGTNTTSASAVSREWRLEFQLTCISTGVSGSVEAGGTFTRFSSTVASVLWELRNAATVTVDTTATQTLQISAQWSAASASNTITMRQLIIEESGP